MCLIETWFTLYGVSQPQPSHNCLIVWYAKRWKCIVEFWITVGSKFMDVLSSCSSVVHHYLTFSSFEFLTMITFESEYPLPPKLVLLPGCHRLRSYMCWCMFNWFLSMQNIDVINLFTVLWFCSISRLLIKLLALV